MRIISAVTNNPNASIASASADTPLRQSDPNPNHKP